MSSLPPHHPAKKSVAKFWYFHFVDLTFSHSMMGVGLPMMGQTILTSLPTLKTTHYHLYIYVDIPKIKLAHLADHQFS